MVGILSMRRNSDAKDLISTFLHFFPSDKCSIMRRLARPLLPLHQHLRPEGGTTKETAVRQPARDASAVPFRPCPQATYLIDIANTSTLNCLLKHLNEKPLSARMGSYPRELHAARFPAHSPPAQKPKCHHGFYYTVCAWSRREGSGGGVEIF